ncbi:MAG: hypothetical protein H0T68_04530 [Gemmatimonadales bacterium]|nr:hypothetical protein [Gemmatimonadales bacterium]
MAESNARERVEGVLLVAELEHRSFGEGKECIMLTLANVSGRIVSSPFWSDRRDLLNGIERGDVVEVRGEMRLYRGRRQLEVTFIRTLPPAEVDWRRLLPSVGDPAPY